MRPPEPAASHSVVDTTNLASGNSEMPLAWSEWRWVITTLLTCEGWIPIARSWADTASPGSMVTSLITMPASLPNASWGAMAMEG